MSFTVFNPFFANHGSNQATICHQIQEVINYAESRFCSILRVTREFENIEKMTWIQSLLHRELMFVMSYIGIATALGLPVDVPIILRSLADIMGLPVQTGFPITFEPEFLETLDLDRRDKDCKYRVVDSYLHQWWTGRKPRNLDVVDILNTVTFSSCLEHYQEQLTGVWIMPENVPHHSYTSTATAGPSYAGPSTAGYSAGDPPTTSCPRCIKYKDILSVVLQDILKFRNFASEMSIASENLLKIGTRKASTFHLLHEAAILKETADLESKVLPSVRHNIKAVRIRALNYLDSKRSQPKSSYKWTWGETLSRDEVLALRRIGTEPGPAPHSGYDVPLREGRMSREYSTDDSIHPDSQDKFDNLPVDASINPPPTHLSMPPYFSHHDRLEYNPLRSFTPISEFAGPSVRLLEAENPISPTVEDESVSLPVTGLSVALQMAENWIPETDESGDEQVHSSPVPPRDLAQGTTLHLDKASAPEQAPVQIPASLPVTGLSVALQMAENWIPETDESGDEQVPAPLTTSDFEQGSALHLDEAPAPALSPVQLPASLEPGPAFLFAESWKDIDVDSGDEAPALGMSNALLLAENWRDIDLDSGDEGSDEGSGNESLPPISETEYQIPTLDTTLRWAENWHSDNETIDHPASTLTRTYGPADFSYLREDMFEDESSDD